MVCRLQYIPPQAIQEKPLQHQPLVNGESEAPPLFQHQELTPPAFFRIMVNWLNSQNFKQRKLWDNQKVGIMVKWLNSPFPNSLNFWEIGNLSCFTSNCITLIKQLFDAWQHLVTHFFFFLLCQGHVTHTVLQIKRDTLKTHPILVNRLECP